LIFMTNKNDMGNLELGLEIVRLKVASQASANQSVDGKVGILLGFSGAIAVGTITFIKDNQALIGFNIFTTGLCALLISVMCLILASKSRTFLDPPGFDTFYSKEALAKNNADLINQVISDSKQCYLNNSTVIETKVKFFDIAIYFLGASVFLLIIGIM
jgi:hypothetical protein